MALSSIDIRRQEFSKHFISFGAYQPREVHDYLETLAKEVDIYNEKLRSAYEQIQRLKADLEHYQKVEEALQEALETARENARKTQQNAEQKAALIIRDAESRSSRMIEESSVQAQKIVHEAEVLKAHARQEVVRLQEKRAELTTRLKAFLNAETELLTRIERDQMNFLVSNESLNASSLSGNGMASSPVENFMPPPAIPQPSPPPVDVPTPSMTVSVAPLPEPPATVPPVLAFAERMSIPETSATSSHAEPFPNPNLYRDEPLHGMDERDPVPEVWGNAPVPPEAATSFSAPQPTAQPVVPAVSTPEPPSLPFYIDESGMIHEASSAAPRPPIFEEDEDDVFDLPSSAAPDKPASVPVIPRNTPTPSLSEAEKIQRILDELQ